MNIVLWIIQGLLALVYLAAGGIKAGQPIAMLSKRMSWVLAMPPLYVRLLGVVELLGAAGLILPLAINILPWLTPAAAGGLVLLQLSASGFHLARREYRMLPANLVLLVLAAFVLYGRTVLIPA